MPASNPFWHCTPVLPEKLIGRDHELRHIIGRILTGQSTAITGAPQFLRLIRQSLKIYTSPSRKKIIVLLDR
jgi:hypothetical protein